MPNLPVVSVSIVSHAQGELIGPLLAQLATWQGARLEVLLTLNLSEDERFAAAVGDLPLRLIRNLSPRGFGANHNRAFESAAGEYFLVLNPDIRANQLDLGPLLEEVRNPSCGVVGPRIVDRTGSPSDSPRRFPTLRGMVARLMRGVRGPEYSGLGRVTPVDWIGGMFMLFRSEAYRRMGGFDERFFMYMEDVDLCRRVAESGQHVVFVPSVEVLHDARRKNRRSARHMSWHLRSLLRYLLLYPFASRWPR